MFLFLLLPVFRLFHHILQNNFIFIFLWNLCGHFRSLIWVFSLTRKAFRMKTRAQACTSQKFSYLKQTNLIHFLGINCPYSNTISHVYSLEMGIFIWLPENEAFWLRDSFWTTLKMKHLGSRIFVWPPWKWNILAFCPSQSIGGQRKIPTAQAKV